ncbi:hypothetical protein HPP92_023354 [Vanilla planifolia]|uniref:Uncharacterized protein n=1 Tax=Vanilla planifolia TaxID=51239 RepID=A0A835PVW3_VANPL|nr:hypothetical protein HPP92_023649 [Vanilla planifolia]KAG0460226.1 hypothetical protein HPP92_023354 [Vanilla planifolia]
MKLKVRFRFSLEKQSVRIGGESRNQSDPAKLLKVTAVDVEKPSALTDSSMRRADFLNRSAKISIPSSMDSVGFTHFQQRPRWKRRQKQHRKPPADKPCHDGRLFMVKFSISFRKYRTGGRLSMRR